MDIPALDNAILKNGSLINTGIVLEDSNFPIDVFPNEIQDIILDLKENMGFQIDYTAASIIYAFSVAIGNTHKLEFKKGWTETALVYIALCGTAGDNKTHPMEWILQPVFKRDTESQKQYTLSYRDYLKELKLDKDSDIIKPIESRFLINNSTIEKLPKIHSENPRGLGYYSEELMNFIGNIGRYSKGDDEPYWLSNWSNKFYRPDRVKPDEVFLPFDQYISIMGGIQKEIVYELLKGKRAVSGFFERWLYVTPEKSSFAKETDGEISDKTSNEWNKIITKVLDIDYNPDRESIILKMTKEAKGTYLGWQNNIADIITNNQLQLESKVMSKMQTYCKRFSLIFEVINWACGYSNKDAVNLTSVERAIKLTEYFKDNSLNIYRKYQKNKVQDDKSKLYEELPDKFSTSEAVEKGNNINISERTVYSYLKDDSLYLKENHGAYIKKAV